MAFRLDNHVLKGEIDNRRRGEVVGRLWLETIDEPIVLRLQGNCLPDLAGCVLTFRRVARNPSETLTPVKLHPVQTGVVGDITASRKVDVLELPLEEALERYKSGRDVPKKRANCLYIEWFSEANGRVVIESTDYEIAVSDHAWTMTPEESQQQADENARAMRDWLNRLVSAFDAESYAGPEDPPDRMNEFQWESFIRDCDARTDRYGELLERYENHPDAERLIAREMGWTRLEDMLDAEARNVLPPADEDLLAEIESPEPNPLTKGIDWVEDESGHIQHPLTQRCSELSMDMWRAIEDSDADMETVDADVMEMMDETTIAAAKMAGALHGLPYDNYMEQGHIVARLKRSLAHIHQALRALDKVVSKRLLPERTDDYRTELFALRQSVHDLMEKYRRGL